MAIKSDNIRIWITIHKDTKKSIELLLPLLKARSMGEVVDRAIISYALAVIELAANKSSKDTGKEVNQDEENN